MSRVTELISVACTKAPHFKFAMVTSRWQHVENLIGLGVELCISRSRIRRILNYNHCTLFLYEFCKYVQYKESGIIRQLLDWTELVYFY